MGERAAISIEIVATMALVLVFIITIVLYFSGSTASLFGKVSKVREATAGDDAVDTVTDEYGEALGKDYFHCLPLETMAECNGEPGCEWDPSAGDSGECVRK